MLTDANGCIWLTLDRDGSSTNTLSAEILLELDKILTQLHKQVPKGLVIKSGKNNGFIAGADISEFLHMESVAKATDLVRQAQVIFDKLAALPCTTVAMINGFCLGGGFELALSCKYRVALDLPKTKIGLPEVLLGVQPGWGGSIRLPRLIGSLNAFGLILQGRVVDARTAYKLGMVDAAVPERHFNSAVEYYLTAALAPRKDSFFETILQTAIIRRLVSKILAMQVAKKVNKQHYPAPFAVLETWEQNSIYSAAAFPAEAESIGRLILTPTAQNLVRLFFLRDRLKAFGKANSTTFKHVHVIGAGVMGGDIAAWCALQGMIVTVQDKNLNAIAATMQRALQLFNKRLKVPFLVQAAGDRLIPDINGAGIAKADVIIEAVIEDLAVKQQVFAILEEKAKSTAILATNTSTIPLDEISKKLHKPHRIVGIHFFNPVALMQLVEVVAATHTEQQVLADAMAFVGKIDKLPLPVKSAPGFLVNRVLIPYLLESAMLYDEGVPGVIIDRAATDFGMMMGPIELMDTVGLDICIAAAHSMGTPINDKVLQMVKDGKLGKKSGAGFYTYRNGKIVKPKVTGSKQTPPDLTDRLMLRLVNEAAACLREGIVADADLVDAGLVLGAGFAPFRGGPMEYAFTEQKNNIKRRLEELAKHYGERFTPDPLWNNL